MAPDLAEPGVIGDDVAAREFWDALVIGAGPAGATAARLLARNGMKVLLVERQLLPRSKVCGGCLNARALASLDRAGVGARVRGLGATAVRALRLHQNRRTAIVPLPSGLAVSRHALDEALALAAVEAGAALMTGTLAIVTPDSGPRSDDGRRRVSLQRRDGPRVVAEARVVVAADGLGNHSLRKCTEFKYSVSSGSRIGVGGEAGPGTVEVEPETITMAVGPRGYVGAVEIEGGRLNIAAAVDPAYLRAKGTTSRAVRDMLAQAGVRAERSLDTIDWTGTILLTRRLARPAARRIFVLGDAAGYAEPFTGEGMAWALAGAEAAVPLLRCAVESYDPAFEEEWARVYARTIGRDQRRCRLMASCLRRPALVAMAVILLRRHPGLAAPVMARFSPHIHPAPERTS